jgi:hypothetical protein
MNLEKLALDLEFENLVVSFWTQVARQLHSREAAR